MRCSELRSRYLLLKPNLIRHAYGRATFPFQKVKAEGDSSIALRFTQNDGQLSLQLYSAVAEWYLTAVKWNFCIDAKVKFAPVRV